MDLLWYQLNITAMNHIGNYESHGIQAFKTMQKRCYKISKQSYLMLMHIKCFRKLWNVILYLSNIMSYWQIAFHIHFAKLFLERTTLFLQYLLILVFITLVKTRIKDYNAKSIRKYLNATSRILLKHNFQSNWNFCFWVIKQRIVSKT